MESKTTEQLEKEREEGLKRWLADPEDEKEENKEEIEGEFNNYLYNKVSEGLRDCSIHISDSNFNDIVNLDGWSSSWGNEEKKEEDKEDYWQESKGHWNKPGKKQKKPFKKGKKVKS